MDETTFNYLLSLVTTRLTKQNTKMREVIPAEERLIATLRFLASGRYYSCLRFSVGISEQTLCYLIPETCRILYEELSKEFMKFPKSEEDWKIIAQDFSNRWQVINCGGALDGKHIRIKRPANSSAMYYNYKNFYSIVLMALVDADYKFIWLNIGQQGRISDGGVFEWTNFGTNLKNSTINFPPPEENEMNFNFTIIGDDAFPLTNHLLKPYPGSALSFEKRILTTEYHVQET